MAIYYRQTTFQQRKYLFELVEQLGNISEACRRAKVSRKTYYHWKPRYEKEGIEGLRKPKGMEGKLDGLSPDEYGRRLMCAASS